MSITEIIKEVSENFQDTTNIVAAYSLSYHDHWLSIPEADVHFKLDSYDDYVRKIEVEKKIVGLFSSLFQKYHILYFDEDSIELDTFDTYHDFILTILDGLREKKRYILYIKDFDIMLMSGYDQETKVCCLSSIITTAFTGLVRDNGLNLLEY